MPNRIIKESIRTSKKVNELSDFDYRVWSYLITYVDDFGRGSADPELLKGLVFPRRRGVTEAQIKKALADLANIGMVNLYIADGEPYFYFPNWDKHQQVRAKKSRFPEPDLSCNQMISGDSECPRNPIQSEYESESNPMREEARTRSGEKLIARGEYGWVKLTDAQYEKLVADLGKAEADRCIAYVDESAQSTCNKNKWKDWNLTVRKCHRDGWGSGYKPRRQAHVNGQHKAVGQDDLDKLLDQI